MIQTAIINITSLLQQVKDLKQTQQDMQRQEMTRVLSAVTPHIHRLNLERYKHAQNFNVFSALGVTRKEVIQSRFLANLLDPSEYHCQNSLFLDSFLTKIGLPEVTDEQRKRVKVHTELWADGGLGRMDIVVDCHPDWLVVIENKIDAGEGVQQLPRYAEWLQDKQNYKLTKLIFLTPTGHASVTGTIDQYERFSYLDKVTVAKAQRIGGSAQKICAEEKGDLSLIKLKILWLVFNDNHSEDHSLAAEIANELWDMFETYHKDIEVLESFKQAAA